MPNSILFERERHARCQASLERERHLAAAARHASAAPGGPYEALLIQR